MKSAIRQLDRRFRAFREVAGQPRPPKGWVRAIRDALGMTSAQIAQPSAVELEQAEREKRITLQTLERAAEALGCRLVYVLIPEKPLEETLNERARLVAAKKMASVEHTMRLEDQAVRRKGEAERKLVDTLLAKPARLWDDP